MSSNDWPARPRSDGSARSPIDAAAAGVARGPSRRRLAEAHRFQGKDAILSSPAGGGIVGVVRTALAGGHDEAIGFDMDGTSTDVGHCAGEFERAFETLVTGVRVRAPMMSIHTVAAGGGSVLQSAGVEDEFRRHVRGRAGGRRPGRSSRAAVTMAAWCVLTSSRV